LEAYLKTFELYKEEQKQALIFPVKLDGAVAIMHEQCRALTKIQKYSIQLKIDSAF